MRKIKKIILFSAIAVILLSTYTVNAVVNMGGKTIFSGTLIEVLEPGPDLQAIINNISDATVDNPYLIKLGPGVYDLGFGSIVMKEWISIQGAGQASTKISGTMSSGIIGATSATIVGASNTSLMDLSVTNTGSNTVTIAIFNDNVSPRIERVSATASGGVDNYGVYNLSSSPFIDNSMLEGGVAMHQYNSDETRVVNSKIVGGVTSEVTGGVTPTSGYRCHGNYDQNLNPVDC